MTINYSDVEDISRSHRGPKEAVIYAIRYLEGLLNRSRFSIKAGSREYYELRSYMPYVIHHTALENTRILVNRNYKPVGSNKHRSLDHLIYEDFVNLHVVLTKDQIAEVVSPPHVNGLYGDGNTPWSSRRNAELYINRLQKLLMFI